MNEPDDISLVKDSAGKELTFNPYEVLQEHKKLIKDVEVLFNYFKRLDIKIDGIPLIDKEITK